MDLYMVEKTRCTINEDHCYCISTCIGDLSANDEAIIGNVSVSAISEPTEQWVDVVDVEGSMYEDPAAGVIDTNDNFHRAHQNGFQKPSARQRWLPCSRSSCLKVLKMLKRCALRQELITVRGNRLPPMSCHVHCKIYNQLIVKCAARKLRSIFCDLSWRMELCYSLHYWCLTNLPQKLLSIYSAAFINLWQRYKISALLGALNNLVKERNVELCTSGNPSVLSILALSDSMLPVQSAHISVEHTDAPSSSTCYSNRSTTTLSNSATPITATGSSICQLRQQDEVILACMTYPAAKSSSRLSRLLQTLSTIGRISTESPEEQECDVMRVRIGLFIRRVSSLLDESKRGPVYLVGFGVGGLVMLLSVVHMHSTAGGASNLDNPTNRRRWGSSGLAGLICVGLPLRGLRGVRGGTVDPLLNLPNIPILLVVGACSRIGSPQDVFRFRRKLLSSQARRRCQPPFTETGCRGVKVVVVGAGADHLLRLRPTACISWGITQETVDRRIIGAVRRFICAIERSFSRYGSSRRPQPLLSILDTIHQPDIPCGSPYSQTPSPCTSPGHPPLACSASSTSASSVDTGVSRLIGRTKRSNLLEETQPILLVASSSSSNLSSSNTSSPLLASDR